MENKKLKPLGNRVLVQRDCAVASKGGILLPDTVKEKPQRGTVLAVGPGKEDDQGRIHSLDVKVGDQVLFSSYAGTEYKEEFLIIAEDDLLAAFC